MDALNQAVREFVACVLTEQVEAVADWLRGASRASKSPGPSKASLVPQTPAPGEIGECLSEKDLKGGTGTLGDAPFVMVSSPTRLCLSSCANSFRASGRISLGRRPQPLAALLFQEIHVEVTIVLKPGLMN